MRQSHTDLSLLSIDGTPYGIALGVGHCAEHEQGVGALVRMMRALHMDREGVDRFRADPLPESSPHIGLYTRKKATKTLAAETRLVLHSNPQIVTTLTEPNPKAYAFPAAWVEKGQARTPLAASWSQSGLCLRAFGAAEQDMVARLHAAAFSGDLLISLGGGGDNPFARSSLCLTLRSSVPDAFNAEIIAQQRDAAALQAAATATGIAALLKDRGHKTFALKPAWAHSVKTVGRPLANGDKTTHTLASDHPVVFYLNPWDQERAHFGWFTVEELTQWANGTGPVLKG